MQQQTWLEQEVYRAVEKKAYAYGVPESICTLLAEYTTELIQNLYVKRTKELVSEPL